MPNELNRELATADVEAISTLSDWIRVPERSDAGDPTGFYSVQATLHENGKSIAVTIAERVPARLSDIVVRVPEYVAAYASGAGGRRRR